MRIFTIAAILLWSVNAVAQTPAPAPQPAPAPPRNVRFDIIITEATIPRPTMKSLVLMINEADRVGSIRNIARVPGTDPNVPSTVTITDKDGKNQTIPTGARSLPLNVDVRMATPAVINDTVRATVTIDYQPYNAEAKNQPAAVGGTASMVFDSGKRVTIIQTVDPITDVKTTIDVTATILK
jgi:hypothetical protein